jgi:L-ascorbate metabolism protein UlaG (beta-lactamase superfamily)
MQLTYLDSNSWLIEIADKRILLDPWLVGALTFGNATWLFKGEKNTQRPIPENIDLILLSQGLEDHAHPPTLEVLDHNLPVVGSPNAAKVVEKMGYGDVKSLSHGESLTIDKLEITAVIGSPVGPNLKENGYLIKDLDKGISIYYEPHGYHDVSLKKYAPIDVVIAPIINLKIPLLGTVIKGQKTALEVCKWLQPKVILPTAAGGDIKFEGLLMSILKAEGAIADFQNLLTENGLKTKVIEPQPGEQFTLELPILA